MKIIIAILCLFLSFNVFSITNDEFKDHYLCFDIFRIKVNIEYDRVRWPNSQLNNVCSINLIIPPFKADPGYFYYSRNWRSPNLCKFFLEDWNKLKKDTKKKVCIAASLDSADKEVRNGKEFLERSAPYEIIKSGEWCHSYFEGYCDKKSTLQSH